MMQLYVDKQYVTVAVVINYSTVRDIFTSSLLIIAYVPWQDHHENVDPRNTLALIVCSTSAAMIFGKENEEILR